MLIVLRPNLATASAGNNRTPVQAPGKGKEKDKGKGQQCKESNIAQLLEGQGCLAGYHGRWVLIALRPNLAAASAGNNRTAVQVPGKGKEGKRTQRKKEKEKDSTISTIAFD